MTIDSRAIDLLRTGELENACRAAEEEIYRSAECECTAQFWRAQFVLADIHAARGQVEHALRYLESLELPETLDVENAAALKMHRGGYLGSLGRYSSAHELLCEAEVLAHDAGFSELEAETHLRQAIIFFDQKNYAASEKRFRMVLDAAKRIGGWYLLGNSQWGIGKT